MFFCLKNIWDNIAQPHGSDLDMSSRSPMGLTPAIKRTSKV